MAASGFVHTMRRIPVVVVLGATGTGKSKLALQIASAFNGEIISADSMQVYKYLDIITNKVTVSERQEVPHHLIDFVDPLNAFTVVDFRNRALPVINSLINRNKLPVIVGGTNYYIESLLWKLLIDPEKIPQDVFAFDLDSQNLKQFLEKKPEEAENSSFACSEDNESLLKSVLSVPLTPDSHSDVPSESLHKCLKIIDPKRAEQVHPSDKRKILRSLQVYQVYNQPHSNFIAQQMSDKGGNSLGGPLRYPHTCILWIQCKQDVLHERLDKRVDQMLEDGLIQELLDFHQRYNQQRSITNMEADYTKGIFQSIGFKEFHKYLMMDENERNEEEGKKLFEEGLEAMKIVTKRYSRKQIKWIVKRFLSRPDRQVPPIYGLDGTDVSQWERNVHQPAVQIVEAFIEGLTPEQCSLPVVETGENINKLYTCDVCNITILGNISWEKHMKSRKHYKIMKSKKVKQNNQQHNEDHRCEVSEQAKRDCENLICVK